MSGQLWEVNALGGFMYSDELTNLLRTALQPVVRFRQLCDAKDATDKGLNRGNLFNWNVYSDVSTGGGALDEQVAMPETNFTITQGQLTITEYGNSVPFTEKLDDLSKQPVSEIIHKVLKNDAKKTLDGAAHAQFNATNLRVEPLTATDGAVVNVVDTAGDISIINDVGISKEHIKNIVDSMKERNIPPYVNDDYYAIAWPTTYRDFKNDLEDVHQYVETGFAMILNGEIGRYESMRFIEQTHVAKGGAEDSTTWTYRNADPWTNAAGGRDWAFFMGEDTVAEAMAIPEEIRGKIPTDFGRSRGVAWYYLGGFGIVHSGFSNSESRITKWESST